MDCKNKVKKEIIFQHFIDSVKSFESWSDESKLSNLDKTLCVIISFLSQNDNAQLGLEAVKFIFDNLLNYIELEDIWSKVGESATEAIFHNIKLTIDDPCTIIADKIKLFESAISSCDHLLNHLIRVKGSLTVAIQYYQSLPLLFLDIGGSIIHFITNISNSKNCSYNSFQSSLCNLLTNLIELLNSVDWKENYHLLYKVCESLVKISIGLNELGELKTSLGVWKCFTFLLRSGCKDRKGSINLSLPLSALKTNIEKFFNEIITLLPDSNESTAILKLIQFSGFYLKIVIVICTLNKGALDGNFNLLLAIILVIYKFYYSSSSRQTFFKFDSKQKETFKQLILVGTEELISNVKDEPLFANEVNGKLTDNSDGVEILILLTTVTRLLLNTISSVEDEAFQIWQPKIITNILSAVERCPVELSCPVMLPDIIDRGLKDISLYAHTAIVFCSFVSILDAEQFLMAENNIFKGVLNPMFWTSQLSKDALCFIGRFGSASLCENHCKFLLEAIMNSSCERYQKFSCIDLFGRLSSFLSQEKRELLIKTLMSRTNDNLVVSQVIANLSWKISPELQKAINIRIVGEVNKTVDLNLDCIDKSKSISSLAKDLTALSLCCQSSTNLLNFSDEEMKQNLASNLLKIFQRLPASEMNRIHSLDLFFSCLLRTMTYFLHYYSPEQMFLILSICKQISSLPGGELGLSLCSLIVSLEKIRLDDSVYGTSSYKMLQELVVNLLSSPLPLVCQQALVAIKFLNKEPRHQQMVESILHSSPNKRLQNFLNEICEELPVNSNLNQYISGQNQLLKSEGGRGHCKDASQIIRQLNEIHSMMENNDWSLMDTHIIGYNLKLIHEIL